MPEYCKVDKADHIMTVTLNRPERLNALHPPANAELGEVFDDYAADDAMWVAIVTGEGRGFSAGNDLRYQAEGGERVPTPRGFGGLTSRFDLAKPVYAAVNGVAMGGGFEIATILKIHPIQGHSMLFEGSVAKIYITYVVSREVWGMLSQEILVKLDARRSLLRPFFRFQISLANRLNFITCYT